MTDLTLMSWNVNGLRACVKKGFLDLLSTHDPDVLCIQEVRSAESDIPGEVLDLPRFEKFWFCAEKKGYAGCGLLTKVPPLDVRFGTGEEAFDAEGRVITAEFETFSYWTRACA